MAQLYFSPRARQDLLSIHAWIRSDSQRNASRFVDKLIRKCEKLASNPEIGLKIDEFPELSVKWTRVGSFLAFFHRTQEKVEIVRVIHGARDWLSLITGDQELEDSD